MTSQEARAATKLRGWKEIARHLRADERTVRRWEERGLPVHRVPGSGRSSVFADPAELDRWLGQDSAAAGAPTSGRRRFRAWPVIALALAAAVAAGGLAWMLGEGHPDKPALGERRTVSGVAALVDEARLQNARATAQGFHRAIELSQAALARDPRNAAAYAELAFAEIRLPDEDATVDRRIAYERAQQAAQHALDIDPSSWRAHSTMGFIEYGYHWNFVAGVRHFREVIRINPSRGPGHNQLGVALLDMGDTQGALKELQLSTQLEASNPIYRAYYAEAQYVAGDRQAALAAWRQILADNPNLVPVREMILDDALARGDWRSAVEQGAEIARLRGDTKDAERYGASERSGAIHDAPSLLKVMLKQAEGAAAAGRGDDFALARIHALAGDRDEAFAALKKALEARNPEAIAMRIDPLLASIRGDPRFEQLAATYGITPSALTGSP